MKYYKTRLRKHSITRGIVYRDMFTYGVGSIDVSYYWYVERGRGRYGYPANVKRLIVNVWKAIPQKYDKWRGSDL